MSQSPERESLEQTLRSAAEGNEQAWRVLVDTYTKRVFGLIKAQCGSSDLAEEITQSAFCTIAAKLGEYSELGRFESWLFRIAMNRLRDEMRRRKRHAVSVDSESLSGLAGGTTRRDVAETMSEEQSRALVAAMARLSESDRRVIYLRHVADLSFRQIADLLGEPLGTVLARQHRALKKLRESMQGEEGH